GVIDASADLTVPGKIVGSGSLTKSGNNTLTLAGANTYAGDTIINPGAGAGGTLKLGNATAIPTGAGAGNVVINGGSRAGTLGLAGFSPTINGLSGATGSTRGQILNSVVSTTATLSVGNNDSTTTFAGIIKNNGGTGGTVALTKVGTGTLTLTGPNTYTG